MTYAASTTVPERESQAEIRTLLQKYGAKDCTVGLNASGNGVVKFIMNGRAVRMLLQFPPALRERPRRWRVLLLVLRAKLEAGACGMSDFDAEFMAHIVVPGTGKTAGQIMIPRLQLTYQTGAPA